MPSNLRFPAFDDSQVLAMKLSLSFPLSNGLRSVISFFLPFAGCALLSGCAMNVVFPDSQAVSGSAQTSLGSVQGNNYGGHAPLVGAHVFVLEADPAATGYYKAAKSLLDTGATSLPVEPAGTAVAGHRYVTTDSLGNFNITGDYTCDAGYPVYLYAEGGNPSAPTAYQNSVVVTGATISGTGPYTIKLTVTGPSLVYQGEILTFAGSGGNVGTYLNGSLQTVLADANLTTTTFDISVGSLTNNGVTLTTGLQSSIGNLSATQTSKPSNPAVVNLAVLGNCPNSGNFTYLNFVYMNEISTVAAAYALAGFFPPAGTSGLTVAGASAANLSVPSGDSLALTGLQNASLTAGQLYDIQGSNNGCSGALCDGESHIARPTTPGIPTTGTTTAGSTNVTGLTTTAGLQVGMSITGSTLPANETITAIGTNTLTLSSGTNVAAGTGVTMFAGAGNGTVPQALIDTLGNILANCVDSANTSVASAAAESAQCKTLFDNTLSAGTSGTRAVDTATAAIAMAHNPWANVSTLISSPTGNAPFSPTITSANDLSIGISYTPANVGNPQGIAVDGSGRIWYTNASLGSGYVTALNPFGGVQYNILTANTFPTYIAIDGTGSAWYGSATTSSLNKISSAGVYAGPYDTGGLSSPYGIAVDGTNGTGYVYIDTILPTSTVYRFNGLGNMAGTNPVTGATSCLGGFHADHMATDNNANGFNLWFASENGDFVCKISATGTQVFQVTINAAQNGTSYSPEFLAIDGSGNAWVPNQNNSSMRKITQTGTLTTVTGGTLTNPFGAAVDGAGNVFVTNRATSGGISSITEYLGSTGAAVSSVNFYGGGNSSVMNDALNLAIDPSGYIWVANYGGSRITELIGVAAPTYTPLSSASYYNLLGGRP
jgi:hypothetical protein